MEDEWLLKVLLYDPRLHVLPLVDCIIDILLEVDTLASKTCETDQPCIARWFHNPNIFDSIALIGFVMVLEEVMVSNGCCMGVTSLIS